MSRTKEIRTCHVSGDECKAPAGYRVGSGGYFPGDKATRGTCFACGMPVCTQCSRRIAWSRFGRRRICYDCKPARERR